MALRVASRRLGLGGRALPPALGMMHQEVGPNLFLGEKVLLLKGFSPRFTAVPHDYAKSGLHSRFSSLSMRIHNCSMSSVTPCNTQNKAKVLIDCASRSGFILSRAMSTFSRPSAPPPEEFTFYIRGGKMATKQDIYRAKCRVLIRGDENLCMSSFWFFVRGIAKNKWSGYVITKYHKLSATEVAYEVALEKVKASSLYANLQVFENLITSNYKLYCAFIGVLFLTGIGEALDWNLRGEAGRIAPGPGACD